jgi:hypothetical protein
MKIYKQNTRINNIVLDHPVGKYFISFGGDYKGRNIDFLLVKNTDGWLTSGLPQRNPNARLATRPEAEVPLRDIWYFDTKEDAIDKLTSLVPDWRVAQNVYKVTEKGFRLIKKGRDI